MTDTNQKVPRSKIPIPPSPGHARRSSSTLSGTGTQQKIVLTAISSGPSPKGSPRTYSRTSSPEFGTSQETFPDDDLPTNVSTEEQLACLPDFCLSGNKERPLRHVNEKGDISTYALQPMFFSVVFILLIELLERFAFYGIQYTQTSFLTGAYNRNWNAGMTAVGASSYVSILQQWPTPCHSWGLTLQMP